MLPLSNQQSNTSEMRCNNPFPQREGMVRWSMLVNKEVNEEVAALIIFKQNRTYSLIAKRKHNALTALLYASANRNIRNYHRLSESVISAQSGRLYILKSPDI